MEEKSLPNHFLGKKVNTGINPGVNENREHITVLTVSNLRQ
jgi:hypothetical protein